MFFESVKKLSNKNLNLILTLKKKQSEEYMVSYRKLYKTFKKSL